MSDNKKAKIAMEEEQRTTTGGNRSLNGAASRAVLVQELQDENIALRALLEQYQLRDSWQRQEDEAIAAAIAASIAIAPTPDEHTPPPLNALLGGRIKVVEEEEGWTTTNNTITTTTTSTTNPPRRSSCPGYGDSRPQNAVDRRSSNVSRQQQAKTSCYDDSDDDDCDLLDIVRARAEHGVDDSSSLDSFDMVNPKGEWVRVPGGGALPQPSYYEGRPGAYPVPGPAAAGRLVHGGQASNSAEEDDTRRGNHDNNDLDIMKLVELRARGEEALAEVCEEEEEEEAPVGTSRLCLFLKDGSSQSTETSSTTTMNDEDSSSPFVVQQDIANLTTARVKTTGRKFARTKSLFSKIFKMKPKRKHTNTSSLRTTPPQT